MSADVTFTLEPNFMFTLTCISTGGPATTVTWTRDSVTVTETQRSHVENAVTAQYSHTLTLQYNHTLIVTRTHEGLYKCSVPNAITVTWTRDSVTVTEGTETVLDDPVTAQYTHTLTGSSTGVYTCTVANNKPSRDSASYTVQGKFANIITSCWSREQGSLDECSVRRIYYKTINIQCMYIPTNLEFRQVCVPAADEVFVLSNIMSAYYNY